MPGRTRPPSGWPPPTEATLGDAPVALVPLAEEIADRYFARFPEDLERYGEAARPWELHDTQHLLKWAFLDVAGLADLGREAAWLAGVLGARDFPLEHLAVNLEIAADVVTERVPSSEAVAECPARGGRCGPGLVPGDLQSTPSIPRSTGPMRRLLPAFVLSLLVLPASASAAAISSNWAGYVAHRSGVHFKSVSAAWTVPAVTCDGSAGYSATWVGIGGYHTGAAALEQAGTESDCGRSGRAAYSAWYELVPDATKTLRMTVAPGDSVRVRVTVNGRKATFSLRDITRGTSVSRRVTAAAVDTTSAEWIVEAPSECVGDNCRVLPLARFAGTAFTLARAVSTDRPRGDDLRPDVGGDADRPRLRRPAVRRPARARHGRPRRRLHRRALRRRRRVHGLHGRRRPDGVVASARWSSTG